MSDGDPAPATRRPPLAVLVSGAPGSGKSTLAPLLAARLDLPQVSKDQLVHARWRTLDRAVELGVSGVELFYRTMELWLELDLSFVADQTFYPGVSEPDIERRLAPRAVLVNVHCRSARAVERFVARMRADPLCGETRLDQLVPLAERLQRELQEPLRLSCPVLVVDTDDGYAPALEQIVETIDDLYTRPLVHDLDRADPSSSER